MNNTKTGRDKAYIALEFYFSSGDEISGNSSNYGDMCAKMALSSSECMQTDELGQYSHESNIESLGKVRKLRKVRRALAKCSPLTLHTLGALFSDDALIARKGNLLKFCSIHHHRLTKVARAYQEYAKTNSDEECFFLLSLAKSQNTPPERLKRMALREFLDFYLPKGER